MPLFLSAVALGLPEGCTTYDSRKPYRTAVGVGWTREDADYLACIEAIERYSIQFSQDAPKAFDCFKSSAGKLKSFPAETVMIGVPRDPYSVTDIGCAAGPTREFASKKAILELLEHHHHARLFCGTDRLALIEPGKFEIFDPLLEWLTDQLRIVDVRVSLHSDAYCFAICACSDLDGARRTEGTAVATSIQEAVQSALFEAVSFWRNMIDLEKNALPLQEVTDIERQAIRFYRGADNRPKWPTYKEIFSENDTLLSTRSTGHLLQLASDEMQKDLHLVDLTDIEIGTPVVRCLSE